MDEVTVPEAAQLLRVSHTTIKNMIARGDLAVKREEQKGKQRRVYLDREQVERQKAGSST